METNCEKVHTESSYPHTPYINERRRTLFPCEDDDSDLGHMSPISTDSHTSDSDTYFKSLKTNSNDYVILGTSTCGSKTSEQEMPMSQLNLFQHLLSSPILLKDPEATIVPDTPCKESPSQKLKTPHDTSTIQSSLPKLIKKSVFEAATNRSDSYKRSSSPPPSPESKRLKVDLHSKTKVRTALFPDVDITVPAKSFYSCVEVKKDTHKHYERNESIQKRKTRRHTLYLCNRKGKKRYGQINAGVSHGVRKPKNKKRSQTAVLEAALKMIEDSPLNVYLKELENTKEKQITPLPRQTVKPVTATKSDASQREPSPPPDPNKKFFKSSHHRGIVKLSGNIKLEVDGKRFSIGQKNQNVKQQELNIDFDTTDLNDPNEDEALISESCIANVLSTFEDEDKENQAPNTNITLEAHTSIIASDNSVLLHAPKRAHSEILSPISQMCDTTSGLALNSPKKAKNLTPVLESMSPNTDNVFNRVSSLDMDRQKLFPIFEKDFKGNKRIDVKAKSMQPVKKLKALPKDQMLLDAGQKKFGPTQCPECTIIYHMGDPSEELMHMKYHGHGNTLKFYGWKNENVVAELPTARIIRVKASDPKVWWKKVNEVLEIVNTDLGYYEQKTEAPDSQVYLYIKNKLIVGCLCAERRNVAYRKLTLNGVVVCSERPEPIKCGVSRIWVSPSHRHQGVATALMNSLRSNFLYDCGLTNNDIGFSTPTESGDLFAQCYFKTPNYLIYS